jgi:hypothetical protein
MGIRYDGETTQEITQQFYSEFTVPPHCGFECEHNMGTSVPAFNKNVFLAVSALEVTVGVWSAWMELFLFGERLGVGSGQV